MSKQTSLASIIVLDDDADVRQDVAKALGSHFHVLATADPRLAIGWLENDKSVGVILVAQVLRSGLGVDVLENAMTLRPEVRRILLTGYNDLSSLIQGLHSGAIHRMISKPLKRAELISLTASMPPEGAGKLAV